MADVSDICDVLVGIVGGLLYPAGTSQPVAIAGISNARVNVGWPVPDQLDTDLANKVGTTPAPICNVSVWPLPAERNTTRYLQVSTPVVMNTPTLTLTAAGQTVTVAGTIPPANNPHNAVIFVNGLPYVYAVQPTDSLTSIATALATLIAVKVPGTSSAGPVITLPTIARLGPVRIGVTGTSVVEVARQEKQFQVSIWADSPANRTAIGKLLDPALQAMTFISLPDFTGGRIRSVGSREFDSMQKQAIYRRDLIFTVEFATTQLQVGTQITQIGNTFQAGSNPPVTVYQ